MPSNNSASPTLKDSVPQNSDGLDNTSQDDENSFSVLELDSDNSVLPLDNQNNDSQFYPKNLEVEDAILHEPCTKVRKALRNLHRLR